MLKEKIGAEEIYLAPEKNTSAEADKELTDEATNAENSVKVKDNLKKNVRVSEISELRERNRKVFKMSDGTEQAVFYSETVHVFNEDTKSFDEVDSTIVEQEDGRHFVCGKNHFVAKFSNEEENDELFSIESGMHRVTVSAKKSKKHINNGKKPLLRKKKTDTLIFESVVDGSDYEYSVKGDGIKENIIVKEKADVYRYPFVIHMDNVTADFDETSKRVSFKSNENGEEVFFIPAPFMTDKNGVISNAVSYEIKNTTKGDLSLNVIADSEWINAEERAFPIVIDPQIQLSGQSAMSTYSWEDGSLYSSSLHTVGATRCKECLPEKSRMYISFKMPTLPRNPRIKKAELKFFQKSSSIVSSGDIKIGLYHVTGSINTGTTTPSHSTDLIDIAIMQKGGCNSQSEVSYTFDVTTLVDQVNKGEISVKNLVLKMINEDLDTCNTIELYGASYSNSYAPQLIINYESSYGVNTSYRTHTHQIGRFGQGSVDLQCGNLMFESEDFAWAGNRMPVTIKHLYNSALSGYQYTANSSIKLTTANFSAMKLGYGYKLNIMQSMVSTSFLHEGKLHLGFVYIDENGEEIFFKESNKKVCCDDNIHCYNLFEDVNGGMLYDPVKNTIEQGDDIYQFDYLGRLIQIKDANRNKMDITYNSNRITCVTDGAGRDFNFGYNSSGFLTSITAPDETSIIYSYSGNLLNTITYPDGRKVSIAYTSNKPTAVTLFDAGGNSVYKVAYAFSGDRIQSVTEYGSDNSIGAMSTYSYSAASGRTIVETIEQADAGESTNNVIKTVYTFDDDGNIVSEYVYSEDTGNVGANGEEGGINPHSGDGGAGVVSNINNLLTDHNFETLDNWHGMAPNSADLSISRYAYEPYAKFGNKVLRMRSYQSGCEQNGVYQTTATLPAGEYTFSAYMRVVSEFEATTNKGAYIRVATSNGTVLAESEHVFESDSEFIRLIAPFTLNTSQSVQVQLLLNGKGTVYFDAPQLENNPTANAYNMLENGNFERSTGWSLPSGVSYSSTHFNMSKSICLSGNVDCSRSTYQRIYVKKRRDVRESFTLSGWAKGYGLPVHDNGVNTTFRLRAVIKYLDAYYGEYGTEEYTADFSPCTEEWQLASVEFSKSKYRAVQYIDVFIDYDYNYGTAYFDDIQLVRNSIETGLSAGDFEGEPDEDTTETTTVSDIDPEKTEDSGFKEFIDCYGNALTETTFTDGEFGTIYRSFKYNSDTDCICGDDGGNNLISETDARGNLTEYTVDEFTSRNEEVIDRCKNKTSYEYDASGRTTKVTSHRPKRDSNGKIMTDQQGNIIYEEISNVSYKYDSFDNLSEIARGDGLKYALKYNAFHNLESIGIDGKTDGDLIKYTYKNGNGKLKEMTYANGDKMTATYNGIGQMVAEKWYNSSNVLTAHYKYVYDGQGNIVRSIDIKLKKEYNYLYEDGRIMQSTESDITLDSNNIVTSKVFVCTVRYYYDSEDNLTKKRIQFANGSEHTVNYEKAENDSQVVRFAAGGRTVTSHSKTDSFGRKEFDELQLGTASISRQFYYHAGVATDEHKNKSMVKSAPTTQLVSQIVLSGGRTISYEYDEEERITKVDDSVDGITEYTYDALGQLVSEVKDNQTVVNTMTYDNYGNILTKNGVVYAYDTVWKDKLISYNGQEIVYDEQGNPVNYLGHTLTWEKGRQLKSFDNIQYTYNANGIRTSKTVDNIRHDYVLDGAKILRETWCNNTLVPLYDNEDIVCGIEYNGTAYYFLKNQQGDIIAITDSWGSVVARYTYDAWGVCTVTDDTSGCGIANINPFRYRGYYYDREIDMYYLQSRYYDPAVGRFVNGDMAESTIVVCNILANNSFAYCCNNAINEVDYGGNLVLQLVKKILVGIVKGFFKQLCIDFIEWLFKKIFKKYTGSLKLSPIEDYIVAILSSILSQFKLSSIVGTVLDIICLLIKYIPKIVGRRMKQSDWLNLLLDIVVIVLKAILGNELKKLKAKRTQIHNKMGSQNNKNMLKLESKRINIKIHYLGMTFDLVFPISQQLLSSLINILC